MMQQIQTGPIPRIVKPGNSVVDGPTLNDVLPLYWKQFTIDRRIDDKRNRIAIDRHLLPFFGAISLGNLTYETGQDYILHRRNEDNAADGTIKREWGVLMRILNLAVAKRLLDANRLAALKPPTGDRRTRTASLDELKFFQAKASMKLWHAVTVGLHTGLRARRILALDESWLTALEDGSWLMLPPSRTNIKKNPLKLPLNRLAVAALKLDIPRLHGGRIFQEWGSVSALDRAFRKACDRAGIADLIFHDLRHTFITALQNCGVHEEVRKALVAHGSADIHQSYSHGGPGFDHQLRDAVTRLEAYFTASSSARTQAAIS